MFKNYSGTIQCSICQSSQDRQSGRRLESMKKNPSWAQVVLLPALSGKACSLYTLITGRKSLQAWDQGGGCNLCCLSSQDKSTVCQNGYSYGLAVCSKDLLYPPAASRWEQIVMNEALFQRGSHWGSTLLSADTISPDHWVALFHRAPSNGKNIQPEECFPFKNWLRGEVIMS